MRFFEPTVSQGISSHLGVVKSATSVHQPLAPKSRPSQRRGRGQSRGRGQPCGRGLAPKSRPSQLCGRGQLRGRDQPRGAGSAYGRGQPCGRAQSRGRAQPVGGVLPQSQGPRSCVGGASGEALSRFPSCCWPLRRRHPPATCAVAVASCSSPSGSPLRCSVSLPL